MSIYFGGIRQLGMVVRDAEAAMKAWGRMGVGPFMTMNFTVDDFVYRGNAAPGPNLTLCFAYSGSLQIELIQQHDEVPSAYTEFLASGREGAQHVCAWYSDHQSYDAKRRSLLDRGFCLVHEGGSRAFDTRFAYFEPQVPSGLMFEISEASMPVLVPHWHALERAAEQWDGKQTTFSQA